MSTIAFPETLHADLKILTLQQAVEHLNEVPDGLCRVCIGSVPEDLEAWRQWGRDLHPPEHEPLMVKSQHISRKLRQGLRFDEACDEAFEEAMDGIHLLNIVDASPQVPMFHTMPTHALALAHLWLPQQEVAMVTLPDPSPWRLFTQLDLGGIDDHPASHEHIALLEHWAQRYEARVIGVTPQSVTLWAGKCPQDWAGAFDLAQSHLDYCPALLAQKKMASLRDLASSLRDDGLWHFEWTPKAPTEPALEA